jgi:hypothetical protein
MADKINDGGPAYPALEPRDPTLTACSTGMSLHDAAALAALQGFCAFSGSMGATFGPTELALRAFEIADAFIATREAKSDGA